MSFLHFTIVYPTGLRDERKQPDPQVVSCSINCVLPTGKSGINKLNSLHLGRKYARIFVLGHNLCRVANLSAEIPCLVSPQMGMLFIETDIC